MTPVPEDAAAAPIRALLVTGDAELQDNLIRILAATGPGRSDTLPVSTVAEAATALTDQPRDVVLLDMLAAGDPPLAAIAQLRTSGPGCALIAITAEPHGFFLVQDLLAAGAQDCLVRQCLLTRCTASESAARTAVWCAVQTRRAERRLDYLAHHDPLTGLANRTLLFELMRRELASSRRGKRSLAVLALDLDGFKAINDRLGHEAGDRVLQEVAARLRGSLREADVVGRLGGDEFVVVLDGAGSAANTVAVQQKIERALALPIALAGEAEITVGASIGIAVSAQADTVDSLLARADTAMYRNKRSRSAGPRQRSSASESSSQD
jgi:diguanylate cyclase (GGDEF)-like protein